MRILVIGSGAREHALVTALSGQHEVHVAPGNPGMRGVELHPQNSVADWVELAESLPADVVVVGPEAPLVAGLVDALTVRGIPAFGPTKAAAQIEGSKAFAKDIMAKAGVATARAVALEPGASEDDIAAALTEFGPHYVVKDDGLAAGKGVVVTDDRERAAQHAREVLAAGNPVLFESFLDGPEISLFCLVDGETVVPLQPAQDHKRVGDNDTGPNTGGMGAYAPLPWVSQEQVDRIVTEVVQPVAAQMVANGTPYQGLLYAGLAWGANGPAVVEFNCRFGDPETQSVLALIDTDRSDLGEYLYATATGTLDQMPPLSWKPGYAVTVVLAAEGYPEKPVTGTPITGELDEHVLFAGVKEADGQLVSAGGRVLCVTCVEDDLDAARAHAYTKLAKIQMAGGHFRSDIGAKAARGEIAIA
ncbi:MAG: phosphoribosylamine--glycine ligase [Corynebacterium sp.]|nr:phosphoribosylamine--glycine ligase [Corynebacterium sp.]